MRRGVAGGGGQAPGPGPAAFLANLETEVLALERELRAGTWRPGGYVSFEIRDPKRRTISAAPFRDRVVHHAVHAVIAPLFERGFIDHTYANRAGKGTHRAVARYERLRDRHRHVLRGDIYRYFPAIDHEVLKADLRPRPACPRTLAVLDRIVDASNPQEPVNLYYPGDDLFTPFERRGGLPIGNLTSQLFANVYLDRFDHFVTEVLRAPYLRYVDDFALFADDPARPRRGAAARRRSWRGDGCRCIRRRRMWRRRRPRGRSSGSSCGPAAGGICPRRTCGASATACGVSAPAGGRAPSRGGKWSSGFAPGWRTRRTPTRGGCAARSSGTGGSRLAGSRSRGPDRPPAAVCCAAARGTTMPRTSVPARATGTPPPTGTTTTVFVFRARPAAGAAAVTAAAGERGSVQGRS